MNMFCELNVATLGSAALFVYSQTNLPGCSKETPSNLRQPFGGAGAARGTTKR